MIIVKKLNESFMEVRAEEYTLKEIIDYFTFDVPGAKFTPAYKKKRWDGKIRLINDKTRTLYLGLISHLKKFALDKGHEIVFDGIEFDLADEFPEVLANKFISDLKIASRGKQIEVRDYQKEAFIHVLRHRRALLLSPTSSGKSALAYLIVRQLIDYQNMRGLIIVPTTSLVEQMYNDFYEYSEINKWSVEKNITRIYSGKEKNLKVPLTISTFQSMQPMDSKYFEQFDFVIIDEAHYAKSTSILKILNSSINAKYKVGLTGTLDGMKTNKVVIEGVLGPVRKMISTKELMERNQVTDLNIKCIVLKHPEEINRKLFMVKDYQTELDYIVTNPERNKFIKNLALSLENNTLILFQFVEKHGEELYNLINNSKNKGNKQVYYIHGDIDVTERERIRALLSKNNNVIVIASSGTFSTGINAPNIHNLILSSPSKSVIKILQSIGRILRLNNGKDMAYLYDIADDMSHNGKKNYTLTHFIERLKIYKDEKFNYKLYKINLKGD